VRAAYVRRATSGVRCTVACARSAAAGARNGYVRRACVNWLRSAVVFPRAAVPAVSKRLGRSSVNITAQIYSHAFTADEIAAAES